MHDLPLLLEAAQAAVSRGLDWCLATVVAVDGSSYRRPGARMVITSGGHHTGTISGGCLEGLVAEHATDAIERGETTVVVLNDEFEPHGEHFGTGCNGRLHVLLEPFGDETSPLDLLSVIAHARRPGVLITLAPEHGGRAWYGLITADGLQEALGEAPDPSLQERLQRKAASVLSTRRSLISLVETAVGGRHALCEFVEPRIRLVIIGDGHDVGPVVRLARELNWEPVVVGRRPVDALLTSFPGALGHHFLMHPEDVLKVVHPDAYTAVVLMSHNYERDRACLHVFLETPCFYVGVLGPARRTARMLTAFHDSDLRRRPQLHAPIGLDTGAETPAEIAVSIAGEIQAVLRGRPGSMLRDRQGPIHEPLPQTLDADEKPVPG